MRKKKPEKLHFGKDPKGRQIQREIEKAQMVMLTAKRATELKLILEGAVGEWRSEIAHLMGDALEHSSIDEKGNVHFPEEPVIDIEKDLNAKQRNLLFDAYLELRKELLGERQKMREKWDKWQPHERQYATDDHIITMLSIQFCWENLGITDEKVKAFFSGQNKLMDTLKDLDDK